MKDDPSNTARRPFLGARGGPGAASLVDADGDKETPRARLRRRFSRINRGGVAGRDAASSSGGAETLATASLSEQPETRPVPESATLEALMERYQSADPAAASELVERLSPTLLRFLAGPPETRDQAEDMLQDCWMRIHRARHTYRPGSPLLPWVFAIARHTRIDVYRRRSRIVRHEKVSDELESMTSGSLASPGSSHRDLWKLLFELPESQREVLKMLKVAGLSVEETARATGSTAGAVKQKAHRAYQRLRKLLG